VRQKRRSYRDSDDEDLPGDDFAAVNDRLDDLTRQLERMAQANAAPRPSAPALAPASDPHASDRVAEALARLDRRLDQVITEGRAAANSMERRARYAAPAPIAPPAPAPMASPGPTNWAAQISARQRALDGTTAAAPTPAPMPAAPPQAHWGPSPELVEVEHQLREINSQISSLHQPYESVLNALRGDLAEIGRTLKDALPQRAIEALEGEVRSLAERVERSRQAGSNGSALGNLEHELAEVRNALQHLTPAESLAGFQDAVQALSYKIDQIGANASAPQDPLAFKQLEQAVISLRGVVSNVASEGAMSQLAAEVRGLAAQFERAAADSSSEALARLETRIASLMESGHAVPPELEGSIRDLSTKLDRMQLSQGDQLALGALEDRIAKLSEKLDASDTRLRQLDSIERGLADLLVHLEEMRNGSRGVRAAQAPEPTPAPFVPPPVPEAAHAAASPLDLIRPAPPAMPAPMPVPMPAPPPPQAPVETYAPGPPPARHEPPVAEMRPRPPAMQMPRGPQRPPIDPNLPGDAPLEPGSGAPRVKPGSAAARIAASEAALGHARPMSMDTGGKSAAIAAARSAAKAAYLDSPVKVPKSLGARPAGRFKWPFKKRDDAPDAFAQAPTLPPLPPQPSLAPIPAPIAADDMDSPPLSRGRKVLKLFKTLLIAASVAIIVVGTAQTAIELLFPAKPAAPGSSSGPAAPPQSGAPSTTPARPMPAPEGSLPSPAPADPTPTHSIGERSMFDPATVIKLPDVTGSISRKPAAAPASAPQVNRPVTDILPATIAPTLRTAALAGNPAAEYEVGARYVEGRGVTQNFGEATVWLQRAADTGFAPAMFRLASLYEKGEGMKKDVQAARRLYLAAAEKGHAKAMHNLAVLYSEGIDGKPDYKTAAEWFRRAAGYGVTDSQYNLAILYARGVGVQGNLAESYRWFALAAAHGDQDAVRKRDEVARRLDPKTLTAAKLAAQTFVPDHEPDEAVNLNVPSGGWDHVPAAPAKGRRPTPATAAQ